MQILGSTISSQEQLSKQENQDLLDVVVDYSYAVNLLLISSVEGFFARGAVYGEALIVIVVERVESLRDKLGGSRWFGNEKDDSFKSSIGQIHQTFGAEELFP